MLRTKHGIICMKCMPLTYEGVLQLRFTAGKIITRTAYLIRCSQVANAPDEKDYGLPMNWPVSKIYQAFYWLVAARHLFVWKLWEKLLNEYVNKLPDKIIFQAYNTSFTFIMLDRKDI